MTMRGAFILVISTRIMLVSAIIANDILEVTI
jgi:hypothetical protein